MIKKFENWKNNIIDNTLFTSGKAKYDPEVSGGKIKYKTGESKPYYFANIHKKGDIFICSIFKKKTDGNQIRIKRKNQDTLKKAHNYVREYLNQKLKRTKKAKEIGEKPKEELNLDDLMNRDEMREKRHRMRDTERQQMEPTYPMAVTQRPKTIIRRFA